MPLELKLLQNVQSVQGVIKLLDFFEKADSFIYVLEKPSNSKDLFDFITDNGNGNDIKDENVIVLSLISNAVSLILDQKLS